MSAPTPIYNARLQWLDHTAPGILDGLVSPPRTEALPPAEFRRKFVNAGLPCIITGATKDWTALSKWSFDWFKTQYGTTQIPIGTDDGNPRMQPIAEYIDRLLSFDAKAGKQLGYAKNVLINKYISGISADVRFPRYHPFDRLTHDGLWFAYDGATSTTHADFAHNMNTPIFGRKLFRLSRPSTVDPVFFHTRNYRATSTWLDYDRPAPPLNGQPSMPPIAHDYKFILEPGEIIFIPYGWWHKVTSIGPSISATHFWHTPAIVVTAAAYLAALNSDVPRRILMKQIGPKNGPLPRFPRVPPAANPGKPRDGWAPEEPR